MNDINDFDYIGVEFRLDKLRILRLTIPGLRLLSKYFGSVEEAFKIIKNVKLMDDTFLDIIPKLAHACIIHDDKKIKLEDIENMLDFHKMTPLFVCITSVISGSMPQKNDEVATEIEGEQLISIESNTSVELNGN